MSSSLSAHSARFNSKLVSYDVLASLPVPASLGPHHKPVAHAALVEALHAEAQDRGYAVARWQLALAGKRQQVLFGVADLTPMEAGLRGSVPGERGISIGFRNGIDQSMAISGVAGARVFVCDNMSMSGDVFAFHRKNTTNLDLAATVKAGFDKFLAQVDVLDASIIQLQALQLTDGEAKALIYEVFAAQVVPLRLFEPVRAAYFNPTADMTDCTPRSRWGVVNAFTRALQDLAPVPSTLANVALGKHFRLATT